MRADLRRKSVPDANHVRVHHNPNPIEHPHVSGTPLRLEGERTGAGHCFLHHLRTEHIPPPPSPPPRAGQKVCAARARTGCDQHAPTSLIHRLPGCAPRPVANTVAGPLEGFERTIASVQPGNEQSHPHRSAAQAIRPSRSQQAQAAATPLVHMPRLLLYALTPCDLSTSTRLVAS